MFEIICCDRGDHPDWDYREVPPGLQRIRRPYPIAAGVEAYVKHLKRHPSDRRFTSRDIREYREPALVSIRKGRTAMADKTAKRIGELIKPLRLKPGAKVNLAKDFEPGCKAGFVRKDGGQLLRTGIAMLADHQRRLAARDTCWVLVCRPAVEADADRQALAGRR